MVWSPPSGYAPDKVKRGAVSESPMSVTHTYIVRICLSVTVWAQTKSRAKDSIWVVCSTYLETQTNKNAKSEKWIFDFFKKQKMNFRFFHFCKSSMFGFTLYWLYCSLLTIVGNCTGLALEAIVNASRQNRASTGPALDQHWTNIRQPLLDFITLKWKLQSASKVIFHRFRMSYDYGLDISIE